MSRPPTNLFDEHAERAVVAAVIFDDAAIIQVRALLSPVDFYSETHRIIYEACVRLQDKGHTRDLITVGAELQATKQLEQIGGSAALAELAAEHISLAGLVHHCGIVQTFSKRRILAREAHALYQQSLDSPDPEALIMEFHDRIVRALTHNQKNFLTMAESMNLFLDAIDRRRRPEALNGLPTGLVSLDLRLGGWKPGALNIIAARPSMGKTSLACLSALAGARAGAHVSIFSLEMSAEELAQRFVSLSHENLTMRALNQGTLTDRGWRELVTTVEGLEVLPIKICDVANLTLEKIRSMAMLHKAQGTLDLLIVDYLQLIPLDERSATRQEAIAKASRTLKLLALELGISILCLSQLNRKCEERPDKRPNAADLRESGALEQDADVILMLYRDEIYNPDSAYKGQAEILIRKHRNGPIGELLVEWIGSNSAFKDLLEAQPA